MVLIGPFFYIRGKLIFDALPVERGRHQADKIDNSFGHDTLYDRCYHTGEYIDCPRGRVVWDITNGRAIIYIDRCIERTAVIEKIKTAFDLGENFTVEHDDHYRCRRCILKDL